jgi:hypothetical protein
MALIHMAQSSDFPDPARIPVGAYSPVEWYNDRAVATGNREIAASASQLVLYTSHHGLCISERESNGRDDSDFYMLIWDEEAQAPYEVMFATTRGWSYPCMASSPDATPEVMAAYEAWRTRVFAAQTERTDRQYRIDCVRRVREVHKGATVRVARGRKVPKGLTARVIGLSEKPAYIRGMELWALLDTGKGYESVLAQHLDLIAPAPDALQAAFDVAA